MLKRKSIHFVLFLSLSFCFMTAFSYGKDDKDCLSSNKEKMQGLPLEGNRSLELVSLALKQEEDKIKNADFRAMVMIYCLELKSYMTGQEERFQEEILDRMVAEPYRHTVFDYWTTNNCPPLYIRFQRPHEPRAPMIHIMTEIPSDTQEYIEQLKQYFVKRNEVDKFREILNAENTKGNSTLDYVYIQAKEGFYLKEEQSEVNKLIKYLCANGASFSTFKDKISCPIDGIKIEKRAEL